MAVPAGLKVEVQGEKEFKSQINNLNRATKAYKAELDALKSSFDKNTTAEEKAKRTREGLKTAIEQQKQKIDGLKKSLEQATAQGNVSEDTLLRMRTAIANATTELNGMEQELGSLPTKLQLTAAKLQSLARSVMRRHRSGRTSVLL